MRYLIIKALKLDEIKFLVIYDSITENVEVMAKAVGEGIRTY
jgi:hypothetical protein